MLTNFIYAKSKAMFEERIAEVPNDAIVFIEDTKEIWTHGTYFDCSALDPNIIPNLQTEIAELRANVNDKADMNGTYPDMTVGTAEMAETLGGRPFINNAEFTFRATADKDNSVTDGMATITKLMGNSVVWNQLLEKSYFSEDRAMATREGTAMISGHKYLLKRTKTQGGCYILVKPDFYDYSLRDNESYIFFSNSENCVSNGTFPTYPHVYCTAESGYVQLIDLTKMFGQGNEPTTIEEYNKRKPIVADEYAYNEGQLIHMNAAGIKSVGDNAWNEQ